MSLAALHGYVIGFLVIGSWVVVGLCALVLRLVRREAPWFWRLVSAAQILLAVQILVGLVLLALGGRPGPVGAGLGSLLFHLSYGLISPLVVLVVAHAWARSERYHPYTVFAVVGLVNFGLTFRAWQVGIFGS